MHTSPLVSVCMITFNHARFTRDAIEGVLSQKVNFPIEYIIADDFSTDGTREILLEYQKKHPGLIRLILQEKNTGAANNWSDLIRSPKGKYIAYFEGDDYWTDTAKLQKQVDFLEQNSDFAICFHNAKIIYDEEPGKISFTNEPSQPEISGFEDLAKGEFIYTATCMFRLEHFKKFPEKYLRHLNNYTLDLHNAQYGKIKYLNEVMSVYRKHKGGIWSMVAREKTLITQLPDYKFYLDYFPKKYRHFFAEHVKNMINELIAIKFENKDYKGLWKYFAEYCYYNRNEKNAFKGIMITFLGGCKGHIQKILGNSFSGRKKIMN